MSRCYVLGSGFSKAVAGLPVMTELEGSFDKYRQQVLDGIIPSPGPWYQDAERKLECFRHELFDVPILRSGEKCRKCSLWENIESVLSFIDLNLLTDIDAIIADSQGELSHRTRPCPFWSHTNLGELRGYIADLLFLALTGPYKPIPVLGDFVNVLSERDVIVTFNYDLVLESELWSRKHWNPHDGYGLSFDRTDVSSEASMVQTKWPVYKLHGSLNWETPGLDSGPITMRHFYNGSTPIFRGYLANESPPPYGAYKGRHSPVWLLPSYLKPIRRPEMLTIWERAHKALSESDEIVLIGYSLPDADAAACILLGTVGAAGKKLTIVDPNAEDLHERIQRIARAGSVQYFRALAEYVDQQRNFV